MNKRAFIAWLSAFSLAVASAVVADKLTKIDLLNWITNRILDLVNFSQTLVSLPFWVAVLYFLGTPFGSYVILKRLHLDLVKPNEQVKPMPVGTQKKFSTDYINRLLSIGIIGDNLRLDLLGYQNEGGMLVYKKKLCEKDYEPGTFCLAEIGLNANFLRKKEPFEEWLSRTLDDEIITIKGRYPNLIKNISQNEIKEKIQKLFELKTPTSRTLKHEIWYQEYSDVLRRLILFITGNNIEEELELYPNLTVDRKDLIFEILNWIKENKRPNLREWLFVSIAAGLMGVDEKSSHAAASAINVEYVIRLDSRREQLQEDIARIGEHLWETANTKERIDASEWLLQFLN